ISNVGRNDFLSGPAGWSCVLMAGAGRTLFLRFLLVAFFLFELVGCLTRGQLPKMNRAIS
ncbi:MAG: hypothetical protein WC076_00935, partial [Terrimicrobiaceae bacterium]